mmetsp:Transcript_12443/g.19689  ORF Transcript_12443/g.19689 Transcript_12443/m.19689 type:complete len:397 (+) Transcript_12443:167-1357(+)|eukprot:CAMPEP_0201612712 /NCGR_PEP_ID=MMETSP0492-20130828/23905_1 /ASSEMBLY_ACC=CAM_ASM_000837 /TAXON_ID=420259 /ORGANISM="Thalassiosira gravida, Strain GMp14c1" /LENGTH=396 /DNA_ID=CAMNT_0048079325 /DNA_START=163 /DNA_END=1353 /DNA_ORIENTATION=+
MMNSQISRDQFQSPFLKALFSIFMRLVTYLSPSPSQYEYEMSYSNNAITSTPPQITPATTTKQHKSISNRLKIGSTIAAGAMTLAIASLKKRAPAVKLSNNSNAIPTPPPPSNSISVLTWNVWFGKREQSKRYDYLVSKVIELAPDVACFQEVTSPFRKALNSNPGIKEAYHVTDNPISTYGVVSMVKKDIAAELSFEEVHLKTHMGRSLLVTKIPISITNGPKKGDEANNTNCIRIGNVHLESLQNESLRRQQLDTSRDYLSQDNEPAMLVGDFNIDSTQNWGDWDRPQHSTEPLENKMLAEIMPHWIDVWPYLKDDDDPGITFDGATNGNVRKKKERMRYDRMMVNMDSSDGLKGGARLEPRDIEMVGTEEIDATGLKASDHFGLLLKVDIVPV